MTGQHRWDSDWKLLGGSVVLYLAAVGIPVLAILLLFLVIF